MKWLVRILVIIGVLIFFSAAMFLFYFKYGIPWKHGEMKEQMINYLEERYLDQFGLQHIRFDFMHGKSYYTYARAQTTGVVFYVERSSDGNYDDGYGYEYWSSFGESLLWPYLPDASISAGLTFEEPLPKGKEVLDHLQYTWWDVTIDMPYSLNGTNKEKELNKLLETIRKMDNDGIRFEHLLVGYMGDYVELHEEDLKQIHEIEKLDIVDYDVWAH